MNGKYNITLEKRREDLCYTVRWSPFYRLNKYIIRSCLPGESGLFQVFVKEGHGLSLIVVDMAFYGGIRGMMRELTDPLCPRDYPFRETMIHGESYVRYSLNDHREHLSNICAYYHSTHVELEGEGDIFVHEVEEMTIRREFEEEVNHKKKTKDDFFVGARLNRD